MTMWLWRCNDARRRRRAVPAAAMLALAASIASAQPVPATQLDFAQAFERALAFDPVWRAAAHELSAVREGVPIARAALRPSAAISASTAYVEGTRTFPNAQNQEVSTRLNYSAPQASLNVRVPVLNFEGRAALRQAQAQTLVAEEQYRAQGLDLVERLVQAYAQVIEAQELAALQDRQSALLQLQLQQTEQRLSRGEGTLVQRAQALAALEVGRSRLSTAENQLGIARQQLTRITGVALPQAVRLGDDTQAPRPPPVAALPTWIDFALRNSPVMRLREHAVDVAREAVRRQVAVHLPRLDAVGSISRNQSDTASTVGQVSSLRTIGVQLSVPLYAGGGVEAAVRQAEFRLQQAQEELRQEREALELDLQRHWQQLRSADSRLEALATSLESARLALRGAQRALLLGLGTSGETAEVQTAVLQLQREWVQARLERLQSASRLQLRAGVTMTDAVADVVRQMDSATPVAEPASTPAVGGVSHGDSGPATALPVAPPGRIEVNGSPQ